MREGDVVVGDIVEEVDLVLLQQEGSGDGVHGSISPPLVEESTVLIKRFEKVNVCLRTQPIQVANLKVGPLLKISACCMAR